MALSYQAFGTYLQFLYIDILGLKASLVGAGWSLYYLLKHLDRTQIDPLVAVPERGIFDRRFAELDARLARMEQRLEQVVGLTLAEQAHRRQLESGSQTLRPPRLETETKVPVSSV